MIREREKTHGVYRDTALISQNLKQIMWSSKNWDKLNESQREALEMAAVKIARILSGDPNFRDHWDDLRGYALLGCENSGMSLTQVKLDIVASNKELV